MNKKIIISLMAVMCILSGCGKQDASAGSGAETTTTTLGIKTHSEEIGKVVDPAEVPEDVSADVDMENNISDTAAFGKITVGGKEYNIEFTKLSDFCKETGFECCTYSKFEKKTSDFSYSSQGYGKKQTIELKDGTTETQFGTLLGIELAAAHDHYEIVPDLAASGFTENDVVIKAVYYSDDFLSDDFKVKFYGNITIGDKRDDVEKKIGKGSPKSDDANFVYYKNTKYTFIVVYESKKVVEIIVINNDAPKPADSGEGSSEKPVESTSETTTTTTVATTTAPETTTEETTTKAEQPPEATK